MQKQFTQEGFDKLKKELEELKAQRIEIADRLKKAVAYGDLSENADYQQAKEDQSFLEGKILEIEETLKIAQVVETVKGGSIVGIGSTVEIESSKGKKETYTIVGSQEANLLENKISTESPLGKELFGKITGSEITVNAPGGKIKYKIIKIK
ncbi:MAG TPA: transcription elongation factor GreA [Candidatus Pacearchaeota archaeon]|nr:transcription elongation factor GreA [Candidatus Parcubacteria bacterium]HOU45754.1 transcription elongation factor GreA [Candidatus Pacearchaeota archaeon]HQI74732.1 transcription elongation factor GreA [Candidatus Pacearchaeota archaeon]